MTRITIEVPDDVAARVADAAARQGVAAAALASQVVVESLPARRKLGFVGIGSSGDLDGEVARRHKEIIADEFATKSASDV